MATAQTSLLPVPELSSLAFFKLRSSPRRIRKCPCQLLAKKKRLSIFAASNAVYTEGLTIFGVTRLSPQRGKTEPGHDPISVLNERIRRYHGNREASRTAMDSEEAGKYIQLVKQQQQRGLQKLKGGEVVQSKDGSAAGFSYKADPYTLRSGDYVVHKKVGVGRFVGIKFDVSKGSTEAIEYVFIEYADGMAKLPVKQASRMLYRYHLYVFSLVDFPLPMQGVLILCSIDFRFLSGLFFLLNLSHFFWKQNTL